MRMMRCRAYLNVHVTLEPPTSERVIQLREGDEVDVDEIVRPARPGRDAMTLAQAIGGRADCFEALGEPLPDDPSAPRLQPPSPSDLDASTWTTASAEPPTPKE